MTGSTLITVNVSMAFREMFVKHVSLLDLNLKLSYTKSFHCMFENIHGHNKTH